MKLLPNLLITSLLTFLSFETAAQQATTPASANSTQATALLSQSAAALTGGVTLTDVTLSGSARRIAGSDDESGTAILKAISGGASRMDLSFPSGLRTEILNGSVTPPTGAWSGPDGVSHPISYHNLLTDSSWFFPAFTIARRLSNASYVATYVGHETKDSGTVEHFVFSQKKSGSSRTESLILHLTQVDLWLDSFTLLPTAISFNIHPDNNALLDIPVEIRFSDYRPVIGTQVPFHVQKYLNNSLSLDLQFQTATLNTGVTAAAFSIQ